MLSALLIGGGLALATALPLAWKWQLGLRRSAATIAALAPIATLAGAAIEEAVALGAVGRPLAVWILTLGFCAAVVAFRFYRDPERTPPGRDDVIVSPADGKVIYVRRSDEGMLPVSSKEGRDYRVDDLVRTPLAEDEAIVVGISLSFLDVHVNRSPIEGRVMLARRFPGVFGSLRVPEIAFLNERATIVIEARGLQIAVVLIASRLVRQIVPFVASGDDVAIGQRVGVIRLGSQVDLVLPARTDIHVTVRPGDRVRAGESVVAMLGSTPGLREGAVAAAPSRGRTVPT